MNRSKLISILRTFSKDEFKKFGDFVQSPFFISNSVLVQFYKELKKLYPAFEERKTDKRKIFANLYPGKPFRDETMRNLISDMLFLAEEFLIYNEFSADFLLKKKILLKNLTEKGLDVLFDKNYRLAESFLNKSLIRDENYYYNKFQLEDEKSRNMLLNTGKSKLLISKDNYADTADALHSYLLTETTKLYSLMTNREKYIYDFDYNFDFPVEILSYIERNKDMLNRIPYLNLYYNTLMLFKNEDRSNFESLKRSIAKNFNKLKPIDRKNIYVVLVNHCGEQINRGRPEFKKEKLSLYKEIIRKNIHYEGKVISHVFFINVVSAALELKDFQWCSGFINKFKDDVGREFREDTFNFCMAMFSFEKGRYDKALESLSKVRFSDLAFKWYVYCLELMIYYSANATESFYSLIDTFRHMIKNKKVFSERRKTLIGKFINTINKLYRIKIKETRDEFDVMKIKDDIKETDYIYGKSWLMKKADEMSLT